MALKPYRVRHLTQGWTIDVNLDESLRNSCSYYTLWESRRDLDAGFDLEFTKKMEVFRDRTKHRNQQVLCRTIAQAILQERGKEYAAEIGPFAYGDLQITEL